MPRLLLPLLLLATQATAQALEFDSVGHVIFQGRVELPGLSQRQVLARATRYGSRYLLGEAAGVAPLVVDSAAHLVSGQAAYPEWVPLRCELVVRAQAGGYTYEVSNVTIRAQDASSPVGPGMGLHPVTRYEPVEVAIARRPRPSNADLRPRSTHMREYCTACVTVYAEVEELLAQLRAEMVKP